MIDKKELYKEIDKISYEILDEIVSPICEIPKGSIWADLFSADIGCYTNGDEKENDEIFEEINKKYKLGLDYICLNTEDDSRKNVPVPFDDKWPLALIALHILLHREDK